MKIIFFVKIIFILISFNLGKEKWKIVEYENARKNVKQLLSARPLENGSATTLQGQRLETNISCSGAGLAHGPSQLSE